VVGLSRMMSHRPQTLAQEAPNSAPMRRSSINHRENMHTEVHPILYSSAGYLGVTTTPTIRPNDGQDPAGSALEVGAFSVDAGKDKCGGLGYLFSVASRTIRRAP